MPNQNNNIYDIRDLVATISDDDRAKQSENNIIYKNTNVSNMLHLTSFTRSAQDESKSTSSQPLAQSPSISVIGVSIAQPEAKRPERAKSSISIINTEGQQQQYSCNMTSYARKRELMANIPTDMRDWWGYAAALDFMTALPDKHGAYIGKLKNTTKYSYGTPQNMPIVAKTASVIWVDGASVKCMLWLGDNEYCIDIYDDQLSKKQAQFYSGIGYWRNEKVQIVEEF